MDDVLAEVEAPRRLFTVDEYYRMADAGVFAPEERVELIEGEIIALAPIGNRHMSCVAHLTHRLASVLGERALVWPQGNAVFLRPRSVPQPDVAVLRIRDDRYAVTGPEPPDVLFLVEVADTSYRYDRGTKLPLYARHGVAEVWIVDLRNDVVEIHRRPDGARYLDELRAARGGRITPSALPDVAIAVDDFLPPA